MDKLFLISIGGSGTRMVESLIHMLAAGGKTQQWPQEIHILMMEMDRGNGNLLRVQALAEQYKAMYAACKGLEKWNRFFRPELHVYYWYPSPTQGIQRQTLRNLVQTDCKAQILSNLLFTEEEMDMPIDNGFKGRPALGIAYFDQLSPLNEQNVESFKNDAPDGNALGQSGDGSENTVDHFMAQLTVSAQKENGEKPRVLVISSCHGGTGATGIPIMEKKLHRKFEETPVELGLLLMLPTFSVPLPNSDSKTPIRSDTFTDKVKTVLTYYAKNEFLCESNGRGYRWTYLLGYQEPIPFSTYSEGSQSQSNPCTALDWYATIAIRQFCAGDGGEAPEPGIYVSSIDPSPWSFRRFETVFPTIAKDMTAMLHTSLIFQRYLNPDLDQLCGYAKNHDVKEFSETLRYLSYLEEFYPDDPKSFDNSAIAKTYDPFAAYSAAFIRWLYDVASHTPVDYPEALDIDVIIKFHGLKDDDRETLLKNFPKEKPEYIRSLVKQRFINAPYLYKVQKDKDLSLQLLNDGGQMPDGWAVTLLDTFLEAVRKLDMSRAFSTMTTQPGVPPIQTPYVLGELFEHRPQGEPPEDSEMSDVNTWALLMALLITVQEHHPIKKKEKKYVSQKKSAGARGKR